MGSSYGSALQINMPAAPAVSGLRRTGAVVSNQAVPPRAAPWMRKAESGNAPTFHFCPTCGSTVYWEGDGFPGYAAVAVGNFADPKFPAPTIAVWEESSHPWVSLPADTPPKRVAKQGHGKNAVRRNPVKHFIKADIRWKL